MARIKHGTLTANTVTTLTIDSFTSQITVVCRTNGAELFFTIDGTQPGIGADDSYLCVGSRAVPTLMYASSTIVKLISASAASYSVIGESV